MKKKEEKIWKKRFFALSLHVKKERGDNKGENYSKDDNKDGDKDGGTDGDADGGIYGGIDGGTDGGTDVVMMEIRKAARMAAKMTARKAARIAAMAAAMVLMTATVQGQVLYEIWGNSSHAKSYLLGTNRLTDMTFLDTVPNVFKMYARCDKVITEFAIQDYEAIAALRTAAILPDSVVLENFYEPQTYKDIDEALQLTVGMGMDKLCRMKPSYLTEMYRTELLKKWAGYDEKRSMETFFEQAAIQQGKPVYGLDDTGETMYIQFDREPFHWQCKELEKAVRYPEREVRQEKALRELYRDGRLNDMAYQVSGPDNNTTISYSDYQIYCRRNTEWVKRLKSYLKDGNCFITLNAIYLGGDEGLIAQLKAAGYRVRAVNRRGG